jgi:hypothetical protein
MKYPRIHGVICNVGNKLFLIGGMQNLRLPNKLIEIYNTTSEQFEPPLSIINEMVSMSTHFRVSHLPLKDSRYKFRNERYYSSEATLKTVRRLTHRSSISMPVVFS